MNFDSATISSIHSSNKRKLRCRRTQRREIKLFGIQRENLQEIRIFEGPYCPISRVMSRLAQKFQEFYFSYWKIDIWTSTKSVVRPFHSKSCHNSVALRSSLCLRADCPRNFWNSTPAEYQSSY